MKVTVVLPDELVERMNVRAAENGETFGDLVRKCLERLFDVPVGTYSDPPRKPYAPPTLRKLEGDELERAKRRMREP